MLNGKFCRVAGLVLAWLIIFSAAAYAQEVWRLDGSAEKVLPRNFRTMSDLKISASAQPSLAGIFLLGEELKKLSPDSKIYLLDLRQESHGFADGFPVSWYTEKNLGNFWKDADEAAEDEIYRLEELRGKPTEFVPLGKYDSAHLEKLTFSPKKTLTEQTAAESAGFEYVRFWATDMIFPAPSVVDNFLKFVQTLPENSWLHFHCQAGHGRTTTFLAMYEILKNPDKSLEEICRRQFLAGGANLLKKSGGADWYAAVHNDRAEKLKIFYKFVREGHAGTFSEFLQKETD